MKITSAHIVVTDKKGQIILIKRADIPIWVIPGGRLEKRESAETASLREFKEETGLEARVEKLIAKYISADQEKIKFLFKGSIIGGKESLSNETKEIKRVNLSNLPKPMTVYEKNKLADYKNFNNKVITRQDQIDILKELQSQLINPLLLGFLIIQYIRLKILGKDNFKLHI